MLAAALSAVLLSAAPQLEAGVSAGAGYDSDLNHADPTVAAIGSGFASVRASGGASFDLAASTNLYGGLRFDDEEYPSYSDLTTRALGVEASLAQQLGEGVALVLTPWASQSWAGDPARDATTLAGQATLRWRPVRAITLRGFYSYLDRSADDPVFSTVKNRVGAGVEWRVAGRTYLSLGGFFEGGDEVFYRATTSGGGFGMGRMHESFGSGQEPYRAAATTGAVSPALELGLDATFHLLASFEARWVQSAAASFGTYSVFVGLGARL